MSSEKPQLSPETCAFSEKVAVFISAIGLPTELRIFYVLHFRCRPKCYTMRRRRAGNAAQVVNRETSNQEVEGLMYRLGEGCV